MSKKVQKSGENSTNIQVENINISQGITYSEAHKIACDVYRSNFLELSKEAAEVAQARAEKITNDQLAALSVYFLIFSTIQRGINSYDSLGQYLDLYIKPFSGFLTKNVSCYQHLEYTGCCSIGIGRKALVQLFRENYGIVFRRALQKDF